MHRLFVLAQTCRRAGRSCAPAPLLFGLLWLAVSATALAASTGPGSIAAGDSHACAFRADGGIRCWGDNTHGQLGNGSEISSAVAVQVLGAGNALAIAAGSFHSCALLPNGSVQCWGLNHRGQLGTGGPFTSTVPATVANLNGTTAIDAGSNHSCAVVTGGTVKCWGDNLRGQLGDGTTTRRTTPVAVIGVSGASALAGGDTHTCALIAHGTIKCWGENTWGQLGNGNNEPSTTAVQVLGIDSAVSIAAGREHTCAVLAVGSVQCWGINGRGELGIGFASVGSSTPVDTVDIGNATQVDAGFFHHCARLSDGAMKCWGWNFHGQIGNNDSGNANVLSPVAVIGLADATAVSGGTMFTCAQMAGATSKCWGYNGFGQLGNDSTTSASVPVDVVDAPSLHTLGYQAGAGGSIAGAAQQLVSPGSSGSAVQAIPDAGYRFIAWSDGRVDNPRTDANVITSLLVTATFANQRPVIDSAVAALATVYEAQSTAVTLTAHDLETAALRYGFDCDGNGQYEIGPQSGSTANCTFSSAGNFDIHAYAMDAGNSAASATIAITVLDSAPVVTFNPATVVLEDTAVPLNASASVPSPGESIAAIEVDCDYDGNVFEVSVVSPTTTGLGCPPYASGGLRVIAMRAIDSEPQTGTTVTATIDVASVNDAPAFSVAALAMHPAASTGTFEVPGFAGFDAGPTDEDISQAVDDYLIEEIVDPDGILANSLTSLDIGNDGTLRYALSGVGGIATFVLRVRDNGGTSSGGIDLSPPQTITVEVTPGADLQLALDNASSGLLDGQTTVYTLVVANAGPNGVIGASIQNQLPANLIDGSWTCVPASSTATCPNPSAGSGDLDASIALGAGEYLRFDIMALVDGSVGGFVTNTAGVTLPDGVTALATGNDTATDQDPIVANGIFADGLEALPTPLTVSGAQDAMR